MCTGRKECEFLRTGRKEVAKKNVEISMKHGETVTNAQRSGSERDCETAGSGERKFERPQKLQGKAVK